MKIWAKIRKEEKILNETIYYSTITLTNDSFFYIVRDICEELDFSTPVILDIHYKHFKQFGIIKFLQRDFIDYEDIDFLEIEECKS